SDGNAGGRMQISKKLAGGSVGTLGASTFPNGVPAVNMGGWYKVSLQVTGSSTAIVTSFIDDLRIASIPDPTSPLTIGRPALVTRGAAASFDDVTLKSMPGPVDGGPVDVGTGGTGGAGGTGEDGGEAGATGGTGGENGGAGGTGGTPDGSVDAPLPGPFC